MRANGFSPNPKRDFFLEDFGGYDFYSSPIDANKKRAIAGKNFTVENGILRKRNGWEEVLCTFDGTPKAIYNLKQFTLREKENGVGDVKNVKFLFCQNKCDAENNIAFWCGKYESNISEAYSDKISCEIDAAVPYNNERAFVFQHENKIYVFSGGIYVFEQKREGSDEWLWNSYSADDDKVGAVSPYVPTTVINIGAVDEAEDIKSSYEEVNLISPYVKNSFSLKMKNENEYYSEFQIANKVVQDSTGFKLSVLTGFDGNGVGTWVDLARGNPTGVGTGELRVPFIYDFGTEFSHEAATIKVDGNGKATLELKKDNSNGVVWDFWKQSALLNDPRNEIDNIVLQVPLATNVTQSASKITNCRFGTIFGADGVDDRFFLSGNPDYPNIVFYSAKDNPLYFPDVNTIACGGASSAITGFSRLGDGTLAIHKDESSDSTIYYCSPKMVTGQTILGEISKIQEIFYTRAGAIGEGVLNPYTQANLAGDNIIVSRNGVFGLTLSNNVATNERYARERSRLINPKLTKYDDLKKATAIVHKNKYYLSVGGDCFVADARYVFTENHDMNDTYNYEWWYWENVPASVWAIIDGELYFGTEDGRICRFTNEFQDVKYHTAVNEFKVDYDDSLLVYDKDVDEVVQNSDGWIVNADSDLYVLFASSDEFKVQDNRIVFGEKTPHRHIIENGKLYLDGQELTVKDANFRDNSFALYGENGEQVESFPDEQFKLLSNLSGETVQIVNVCVKNIKGNEVPTFQIADDFGVLKLEKLNGIGAEFPNEQLVFRRNVCAEWYTPMLDLGAPQYLKSGKAITIASEPFYENEMLFGYVTRVNSMENGKSHRGNGFDFKKINFNEWTLDFNDFAERVTKRIHEKNINYVMLKVVADNNKCATINNMSITYTLNSRTKGVR